MMMDRDQLLALQTQLASGVILPSASCLPLEEAIPIVALDVQYKNEIGHVAAAVRNWGDPTCQLFGLVKKVKMAYVPGFFAFREGPLLVEMLHALSDQLDLESAIVVIDGHGIAHPRRLGLASWVGVKLGLRTIGVAKDTLLPYEGSLAEEASSTLHIFLDGEEVGRALRTRTGVKPIFVSPGHRISIEDAVQIAWELRSPYRIIEPIRQADQTARAMAKGEIPPAMTLLD